MANLILLSQTIDDETLAVTSEAAGHLKECLQDRRLDTSWKSTTSANQNIDIDFGADMFVDHILLYHNLPNDAAVRLWSATASDYSDEFYRSLSHIIDSSKRPVLYFTTYSGGFTFRYWRVKITALTAAAEVYLLFIGRQSEITVQYNNAQNEESKYRGSLIKTSYGGKRYSRTYFGARKSFRYRWEYLDLTNQTSLQTLIANSKGPALPFFMKTVDGAYYYVRLMNEEIGSEQVEHHLFNIGPLLFEEEF